MSSFLALSHIIFELPNGKLLLNDVSFSVNNQLTAIVGSNGVGKTVLAKIASKVLKPTSGEVRSKGRVSYIPQYWEGSPKDTVARVLGLDMAIQSIHNIKHGKSDAKDYKNAEPWWDWELQLKNCLNLIHKKVDFDLNRAIDSYSGGEQLWILWAAAMLEKPDLIIMDEPSNHLDQLGRQYLYDWLKKTNKAVLIVSHDRELLNRFQHIIELSPLGLFHHLGNFQQYRENHKQRLKKNQDDLKSTRHELQKIKGDNQKAFEKQQQRVSKGKFNAAKRSWSALEIGSAKNSASASLETNRKFQEARLHSSQDSLSKVVNQQEWLNPIDFTLPQVKIPSSRKICTLSAAQNGFPEPLHPPINLEFKGPQRIHLIGRNGAGKSLLLSSLLDKHKPKLGTADIHVEYGFLDQHCNILYPSQSAVENFQRICPELSEKNCRDRLAWIRIRGEKADISISSLSGGERLKVAIACTLLKPITPELLLLDEPSNHMDLDSMLALEDALDRYYGAIILVSHDPFLVQHLKMTHQLNISTGELTIFPS